MGSVVQHDNIQVAGQQPLLVMGFKGKIDSFFFLNVSPGIDVADVECLVLFMQRNRFFRFFNRDLKSGISSEESTGISKPSPVSTFTSLLSIISLTMPPPLSFRKVTLSPTLKRIIAITVEGAKIQFYLVFFPIICT